LASSQSSRACVAECGFCLNSTNVKRIDDAMKQTTGAMDQT
jgi:hypothetical protein